MSQCGFQSQTEEKTVNTVTHLKPFDGRFVPTVVLLNEYRSAYQVSEATLMTIGALFTTQETVTHLKGHILH